LPNELVKRDNVESAEDIGYKKMKEDFYKCLKIEVIYNSILKPIIKLHLIDLKER